MNTEEHIRHLDKQALDQWCVGNVAGCFMHADDAIVYFGDIGAQNGMRGLEAVLKYAAEITPMIEAHKYEIKRSSIQCLRDDVAVHSYHYLPSSLEGQSLTPWRASQVYHKKGDVWKLVHSHWSMNK